jgi:hypothetical protein
MADNTTINTGVGGDVIRDKDRTGVKTQIVGLDINPSGSEVLGTGDATNGLDVDVTRVQGTVATSMATNTPDVTDRAARLVGVVTEPADTTTGPTAFTAAQPTAGTPVGGGTVSLARSAQSRQALFDLTGSAGGSSNYVFERSNDSGTTWKPIVAATIGLTTVTCTTSVSGTGYGLGFSQFIADITGATNVRLRCTVFTGGDTLAVKIINSPGSVIAGPGGFLPVMGSAGAGGAPVGSPLTTAVYDGTNIQYTRGNTTIGTQVGVTASNLVVSSTAAVSTGVTATLPAIASQFHYITRVELFQVSSTTAGAAGAPLTVTTTNLPGSLTWTRPTLVAGGGEAQMVAVFDSPLKSSVVNTATTIVAPVHTNIIWRINVYYYGAP